MRRTAPRVLATSPFSYVTDERPPQDFLVGERVTHDHYGLGKVVALHGEDYVTVNFGTEVIRFPRTSRALYKV